MTSRFPLLGFCLPALAAAVLLLGQGVCSQGARADGPPPAKPPAPKPAPKPPPPEPPTVVHVPADELDVLLKSQGKAVILTYAEFRALMEAANLKQAGTDAAPPVDAVRLSGEGTLDLSDEKAARFTLTYRVRGLAPGPRSLGWASGGAAFESVKVEPEDGAGPGRYEEKDGLGRLYLDGPGVRKVTVVGSAVPLKDGGKRLLDLWLPNPAAMSIAVTLPPGVEATLVGEGPPVNAATPPEKPLVVVTRPTRGGNLKIAWAQSAKGTEGPSVLDGDVKTLHTLGDGVVHTKALVKADVLRTPTDSLTLSLPADLTVHAVEGPGVTGSRRSEDRRHLTIQFEKPVLGTVQALVQGERPYKPGPGIDLPRIALEGAMRHRGEVALLFGPDVNARAVTVEGGRRVAGPGGEPSLQGVLRYALARADAGVRVDVEPGRLRVDASSTYYLNLAEPGQNLIATITYRVAEGALFRLSPRFPKEFDLRELTLNGSTEGFTRDRTADGQVEIVLAKVVPVGGEVLLQAVLERARADWVPEKGKAAVALAVPSAAATREEGYVAVGADTSFEVLDTGAKDLLAVGAADLTARGLSAAGLVYGYRLDGTDPSVALTVERREPLVEAEVVTVVHPRPRRVDLESTAVFRIQRAGVRQLFLDLPATAGEQVDWRVPWFRAANRLKERPADLPQGYDRWQVDLEQRVVGTQVVTALWFLDRTGDDWTLAANERLAARAPVERAQRLLVVRRSEGLEVSLPALASADVRTLDVDELPPEASADPREVLEVLRLPPTRDGVDLKVAKHSGAAVLNAIATEVRLDTAVAMEGILRTKATVQLFNVDRQFVDVALPPGSTLIGAVVDGRPVKPLVDPRGVLLVTVSPTRPTVRNPQPRTNVVLTYETRLDGAVGGRVTLLEPRFPGLEVLHTTHEVAFEDTVEVAAVRGDLLAQKRVERPTRDPWLVAFFRGLGGSTDAAGAAASSSPASSRGSTHTQAESRRYADKGKAADGSAALGADAPVSKAEPSDSPPPPTPAPVPARTLRPAAPPPTSEPALEEMEEESVEFAAKEGGNPQPAKPAGGAGGAGGAGRLGGRGAGKAAQPQGPGEGGEPLEAGGFRARARRGQLSLDVPVYLGPRHVTAQRIGGGGTLDVELVSTAGSEKKYLLLGLAALALGLVVVGRRWLTGPLTVLAGLATALVLHLTLGSGASTWVAALADAFTLLTGLLLLKWAALTMFGSRAPAAPPPEPPAPPAPAAVTALALLGLWVATAGPARADDAPPATPPAPAADEAPVKPLSGGGTVYVAHDPDKGVDVKADERVFVPLTTWLELQKKAHPERDPELVALGRMVTLVETTYRVEVGATSAEGSARIVLAQRGKGLLLVPLPLPGLAITEARLDGQAVRLLLDGGQYRVPLEREGDHVLELAFHVPVGTEPAGRTFAFGVPTFAAATLDVAAGEFDGDLRVTGAGRVALQSSPASGEEFLARVYLGRAVNAGAVTDVRAVLAEKTPASLPAAVRTRAESRAVHSLRDGGTETVQTVTLHVLQGKAPFLDLDLAEGVNVLQAWGPNVMRWETGAGRIRLIFNAPAEGKVPIGVRTFRPAGAPEREEQLPELAVRDTTGESGLVIVNGDPTMRVEVTAGAGLFRTGRPGEADAAGPDGQGRVAGAWRFAARPAPVSVKTSRAVVRLEVESKVRVTFGDDRVRSQLEAKVRVQRAQVGDLVFRLPGTDELRAVEGARIQTWWTEGTGENRRLFVRYGDLVEGEHALLVRLERRLAGARDGLVVPRWELEGAQADRGTLVLFTLPDVEPAPGGLAGLKALPPGRLAGEVPNVPGARATHAFEWESPVRGDLPVVLRTPEQEVEAVVVTQVAPSDEEQRLEHLVVFDVRRGAADRLSVFVPDGGLAVNDVVRARDLREVRWEAATRTDADGKEVAGRLYTVKLQSPKSGLIEVTVSQLWPAGTIVRVLRPEGPKAVRWFCFVRTFLDGDVTVKPGAGAPDKAEWADVPFTPTGLDRSSVLRIYAARAPYTLEISAKRSVLQEQADAVVLVATAEVVVGLDGEARVRARYRLFNRSRQFLRLKLPEGAVLYGAVRYVDLPVPPRAPGQPPAPQPQLALPIKPLAGTDGTILLPVPKVPLGGTGYEVAVTYRTRVGPGFAGGGAASLLLPQVPDVAVDRTAIALRVPEGFDWSFETKMTSAEERDVIVARAEAMAREVREVLKVAETGTFEQRAEACSNSAPLLDDLRHKLADLEQSAAKPEALLALRQEVDRLALVQTEAQSRCSVDAGVFYRDARFEANNSLADTMNGQTLVVLDPSKNAPVPGDPMAATTGANWQFNAESVPVDRAGKKELVELKERIHSELERRASEETRKSVDWKEEAKSRGSRKDLEKAPAPQQAAPDEATLNFDQSRNAANMNDALRRVQQSNRQIGGETYAQQQVEQLAQQQTALAGAGDLSGYSPPRAETFLAYRAPGAGINLLPGNFTPPNGPALPLGAVTGGSSAGVGGGGGAGGRFRGDASSAGFDNGGGQGAALPLSAADFDGEVDSNGDGDFRGRTENIFNNSLGQTAPDTRVGLMGVDVPLPKDGRVYWFTAAGSASDLTFEGSPDATPTWLRVLLAVLALGALGYGLLFLSRRRHARA